MSMYEELNQLYERAKSEDWEAIEARYRKLAAQRAGEEVADEIASVSLAGYEDELMESLEEALGRADDSGAQAVYFEYDIDNDWSGFFFICPEYYPESDEDDEWATEFEEEVRGPSLPEFARVYEANGGFEDDPETDAVTLYLIARTVCAFGRCVSAIDDVHCAVCLGYHDQDPIWRLREVEAEEDLDFDDEEVPDMEDDLSLFEEDDEI